MATTNNNVLNYEDIPQVAMDAMNGVHREELDIVNQVNAAILAENREKITSLCKEWLEHTKAHFSKENEMMETYHFPALHCHYGEHVEALQTLESIINTWKDSQDIETLANYVQKIWPNWYVNHISTMDVVTSAFIKQCCSQ